MEKSTLELKVLAIQGWGAEGLLLSSLQPDKPQVFSGVLCSVPSPDHDHRRKVRPDLEPFKKENSARQWWHTSSIPALQRQTQADLRQFKASLVYRVGSKTDSKATQRNPVSKNQKKEEEK